MPLPGDLTLSGRLYEGNFEEWHARAMASLRIDFHLSDKEYEDIVACNPVNAASFIASITSRPLLARVAEVDMHDARSLLRALKGIATPFRFLDLPAEIRNIVYEMALPEFHWIFDFTDDYMSGTPAIIQVNSQTRQEALFAFYTTTKFCLDVFPTDADECKRHRKLIQQWSRSVCMENTKHLRHIRLWVKGIATVDIKFSVNNGLTCKIDRSTATINDEGEQILSQHVEAVESTRNALDAKGQSVLMALLSNMTIWEELRNYIEEVED